MNIKTLLLGSAAALVAVSGARAADAVVAADPEPAEYVRVCDAYGAGYFYIPGTETCLKIGGFVRYEIYGGDVAKNFGGNPNTGFLKQVVGRVEFDAKNESDMGTVASYIRLNFMSRSNVADFGNTQLNALQASLGIGGLEMGFRDSQWNRFSGYGGLTEGEVGGYYYGYQTRHYISYTYTSGDYAGIISLDHDGAANYVPDVMLGAKGKFGTVGVSLSAGIDTNNASAVGGTGATSIAFKGTVDVPVGPASLRLVGFYKTAGNLYWDGVQRWGVIAGVGMPIGEKASVAVDFTYQQGGFWDVTGNLRYTIAPGLNTLLEVSRDSTASTAGMLRFERAF